MNDFFLGGVNAVAFLLCAGFVAYVVCIVVPVLRHRPVEAGDATLFDWHFLIPCLDEERVIAATVADLLTKFPSCHVWCIDDASQDDTLKILSRLMTRTRQVHIVRRRPPDAQKGKGPALNAGWKAIVEHLPPGADLDRIIVGVVDADGSLDPNCLAIVSGPLFFGNPDISAVQILVRVKDQKDVPVPLRRRLLTGLQDLEFTSVIAGMQMLRSHVGSSAMGGNGQFTRASALQKVTEVYGEPWQRALVEDFELGLRILLTGGETEYCHDTWVAQQGPPSLSRLVRQRSRWAQGMMQCFRYFMPVMRCRYIGTGAAMEIAVFLLLPWVQLMGTVVYIASLVVLSFYAINTTGGPLHWLGGGAWGLIPLFLIFGLAPLACWGPIYRRVVGHDEVSRTRALVLGLANWPYSYIAHIANYWAFGRMLRSRHDWKKTERVPVSALRTATSRTLVAPASVARSIGMARGASDGQPALPGRVGTAARGAPGTPRRRTLDRPSVARIDRSSVPRIDRSSVAGSGLAGRQRTVMPRATPAVRGSDARTRGPVTRLAAVLSTGQAPAVTAAPDAVAGQGSGANPGWAGGSAASGSHINGTGSGLANGAGPRDAVVSAQDPPPLSGGPTVEVSLPVAAPERAEAARAVPVGMAQGRLRVSSAVRAAVVGGRLRVASMPDQLAAPEPAQVGPSAS